MEARNGSFLLAYGLFLIAATSQGADARNLAAFDYSSSPVVYEKRHPDSTLICQGGAAGVKLQAEQPVSEPVPMPQTAPPIQPAGGGGAGGAPQTAPNYGSAPYSGGYGTPAPAFGSAPQAPQNDGYAGGGAGGQSQIPPFGGAPEYGQQPLPQYGQPPQYGQQPPPKYGQQPPPYNQGPQYGPGDAPSYNTGIQYGQQYPPLQPQGAGYGNYPPPGGAYGGGAGYQDSYHVPPAYYQGGAQGPPMGGGPGQIYSDRQVYAPAGTSLPISLQTAISTQVAKVGDYIQASISENVSLGGRGYIPSGTQVVGTVSDATAGRRLSRSGELSLQFNSLRLPNGQQIPISAHLVGDIGKYKDKGTGTNDVYRGEGWGTKVGQTVLRGGGGAGLGAALGTGVGAIAGGGHGAGMGAWSGAAIGGGIGLADMLLRKGKDVIIPTGTAMTIQLDQPVDLGGAGGPPPPYGQQPGSYSGTF